MKRWATARELIELFPDRWNGCRPADVHSALKQAVRADKVSRKLDTALVPNGESRVTSPSIVWHFYTPDVRLWLKTSPKPQRRNTSVRTSPVRSAAG